MTILLSKKSKTSELIGQEMGLPVLDHVPDNADFVIRWGTLKRYGGYQLNSSQAISRASNKKLCRQILADAGIPVPQPSETDFPVIGRPERHRAGKGFFVCRNEKQVRRAKRLGAVYFSKLYPKQNEYRVHVGGERVLLMSIKEGDKTSHIIWNKKKNDFTFRHMKRSEWLQNEHLKEISRIAKRAIAIIGLDFGAVDIMADAGPDYLPAVVCEINTAPSLSLLAMKKYIKYFRKEINNE